MGSSLHARATPFIPPPITVRMNAGQPLNLHPSTISDTPLPLPMVRVSGDYELTRVLGRGGMGIVYLARQRGLKRNVAYKVLTQLASLDPDTLERFRVEAETLAKLHHPNIVQVFDTGTDNGTPFLAMEYVAGGSLAEKTADGPLAPLDAAAIIAITAAAVGHAHTHGIIHRDLKPGNILLTADGQPKVADFGLARDLATDHLTHTGMIAGTPKYMAPEQLCGHKDLSPAVDVWALGVLLYEILAGTVPFAGSDPQQILNNVLQHEPVSLRAWQPDLPRDLETICLKCLQKEPHRRYATGTELAEDLSRFLNGISILARPVGTIEKGVRWCRKNRAVSGLVATVAVTMVAATSISLAFAQRAERERGAAVVSSQAEAQLRLEAEAAVAAEKKARAEAERAVAAEKKAREEAERAVAAEKKSRDGALQIAATMQGLLTRIQRQPITEFYVHFEKELDNIAVGLAMDVGDPLVRADLYATLSGTHIRLGDWKRGIDRMEKALAIREKLLPANDPVLRKCKLDLGYCYVHGQRGADAVRLIRPIVEEDLAEPNIDPNHAIGRLGLLRIALNASGEREEEDKLCDRIMTLCIKLHGADHPETHWMRVNDRRYSAEARNFAVSIPIFEKAYQSLTTAYGDSTISVRWTRSQLGRQLLLAGRHRESIPYLKAAYDANYASSGSRHPHTRWERRHLLWAYDECKMYAEDLPVRRAALEDAYHVGESYSIGEHLLKYGRDLWWKYR